MDRYESRGTAIRYHDRGEGLMGRDNHYRRVMEAANAEFVSRLAAYLRNRANG